MIAIRRAVAADLPFIAGVMNHYIATSTCIGRVLLADLIERARSLGHRTLIGGACTEAEASLALQRSFGFRTVGVLKDVGYKFGRWLDVEHTQLML